MTTEFESLEEYVAHAPEKPFSEPFYQNTVESHAGNPWWGTPDYDAARKIGILGVYADQHSDENR